MSRRNAKADIIRFLAAIPKPTAEQLHQSHSDELVDALQYGTRKSVLRCLKQLDKLDGEAFQILLRQLDGSFPPVPKFRNRFEIIGTPGRVPHPMSQDARLRAILRKDFRELLDKGLTRKQVIYQLYKWHGLGRSAVEAILAEPDDTK